ncbi:MAG: hypothetical protein ACK5EA_03325 [Planctomycetaceae bacterium]
MIDQSSFRRGSGGAGAGRGGAGRGAKRRRAGHWGPARRENIQTHGDGISRR